jgi:hypothetical protein
LFAEYTCTTASFVPANVRGCPAQLVQEPSRVNVPLSRLQATPAMELENSQYQAFRASFVVPIVAVMDETEDVNLV